MVCHAVFLSSELQAAQIVRSRLTRDEEHDEEGSPQLKHLQAICETLNIPEPREPDTAVLFSEIENKVSRNSTQSILKTDAVFMT